MTHEELKFEIDRFIAVRQSLVVMAAGLADDLRRCLHPVAPGALIESRAMVISRFAGRILRSGKCNDPLHEIPDLVEIQIVTRRVPEVERVVNRIRQRFPVILQHSEDQRRGWGDSESGHDSEQLMLALDRSQLGYADLPESVLPLRIAVRVNSLLQYGRSPISRDQLYPSSFGLPDPWQKEATRIAANLESGDGSFAGITTDLATHCNEVIPHMNPEAIREELQLARFIQEHVPDDASLVERQARLVPLLRDWTGAAAAVEEFSGEMTAALWCCLGLARRGRAATSVLDDGRGAGIEELKHAVELDGNHIEALLILARHVEARFPDEAAGLYARVLEQDCRNPLALSGSLRAAIRHGEKACDLSIWAGLTREAVGRCNAWIEVGMNRVAALRLRALFLLLSSEDANGALFSLAEAIQSCGNSQNLLELRDELAPLHHLQPQRTWFNTALRMVSLALLARAPSPESRSLVDGWAEKPSPVREPVWILAGGCAPESENAISAARPLLDPAFRHFRGTVFSGGTRQGVGGLVGAAAAAARPGQFASIGYLPTNLESTVHVTPDNRYSELRRKGSGTTFSWNEPLHMWADILRAGISPARVTLLGINGGAVAALEFRLAAALGARVGILADSGRAASQLNSQTERERFPSILRLPADAATIRLFMERWGPSLELPPESLERLAQRAHEQYLNSISSRVEPSHQPWERLDESLKESNRDQVRRSVEVLRLGGYAVRPLTLGSKLREFSTEEIEVLAEAEHGRWILERLEAGWQLDPVKDVAQKRSPYLVPWNQLEDKVKEWDRRAVRNLGTRLRDVGLEIVRPETDLIQGTNQS